jgi:hypothetical protein
LFCHHNNLIIMFDTIKRLQKKPESVRRRIAFGISIAIVFIIALIWISTLSSRTSSDRVERIETLNVTPLSSVKDSFSQIFDRLSSKLRGVEEYVAPAPKEPLNILKFDITDSSQSEKI